MSRISTARWSLTGIHLVLFSLTILAVGYFSQWSWHAFQSFILPFVGCGVAAFALTRIADPQTRWSGWGILAFAGGGVWLAGKFPGGSGVAPIQWIYVVMAGTVGVLIFHRLRAGLGVAGTRQWQEDLRIVSLPVLAVWLFRPFLTSAFFGGVDARSYGYGMADVLAQARAGVFPVFVGQSEFMFAGVVHPIRSAPYHHYLGMLLDVLTCRTLDPVAVQHLTVVVTAMLGATVCYLCLVSLAPHRRWLAWVTAVLYVSAPAVSGFIYGQEMYMTFMAFAWVPLVLFGNVRLIRQDDWIGWKFLTAGLVLVWVCHAPVGLWLTLGTVLLQGLRLLTGETTRASWLRAFGGVGLFALLSAYYFWSIGELMSTDRHQAPGPGSNFFSFVVLLGGLALLLRYLATGKWQWLVPAAVATVVLWFNFRGYAYWLIAGSACALVWVRATALRSDWQWRSRLPEVALVLLLAAGVLTLRWLPADAGVPPLNIVRRLVPSIFLPLTERANTLTDLQLGYALLVAWLVGVTALFGTKSLEVRLTVLVGIVGMVLIVPVPGLTRFLLASVPEPVNAVSSVSLWLRYLPTLLGLCAFMGFLGAVAWSARHPRSSSAFTVLFCLAALWSLRESGKFVRSGFRAIQSTGKHLDYYRPENITQFAYIFAGMPISPYQINGVADYHLESRLLRVDDPSAELSETVPTGGEVHWEKFAGVPDSGGPNWLNLAPTITLDPGEYCLLRFRFFDQPYKGVLILRGANGWYREYQMPEAGFGPKSFGVAAERPKTLAIWNSSAQPQPIDLVFYRPGAPFEGTAPRDFVEVAILPYDPEKLPIRTLGLIPYRATVTLADPAFIETPRMFIKGYQADVNGQSRPALRSPNHKVMVKLDPGENRVRLRYVGTKMLWCAFALSAVGWLWVLGAAIRAHFARTQVENDGPAVAS